MRYEVGVEEAARRNCLQKKVDWKEKMHETGMQCPRKKQKPQGTPWFAISIFPTDEMMMMMMIPTMTIPLTIFTVFNVYGSVHRKNILIYIQQDATLHGLFYL